MSTPAPSRPTSSRLLGWDFLRGLCALAVCTYHLLMWMGIAEFHTWGLYGVYIFFVLSGASLTYTYEEKFDQFHFSFRDFLLTRYLRLAPLYILLLLILLPWKIHKEPLSLDFLEKLSSNLFLLFGFYHPATQSMLVGGWSLGIEVVFYFLFPIMMWTLRTPILSWLLWFSLLALQITWIMVTTGATSFYSENWVTYHHPPAFSAYFMGGCLIGHIYLRSAKLRGKGSFRQVVVLFSGFLSMLLLNMPNMADILTGWHGAAMALLCFVLVAYAGFQEFSNEKFNALALSFGNSTYGLYLIHPVIYFGLIFLILPKLGFVQAPEQWLIGWRVLLAAGVLISAYLLALASEHYFERPVRRHARMYFERLFSSNKV